MGEPIAVSSITSSKDTVFWYPQQIASVEGCGLIRDPHLIIHVTFRSDDGFVSVVQLGCLSGLRLVGATRTKRSSLGQNGEEKLDN